MREDSRTDGTSPTPRPAMTDPDSRARSLLANERTFLAWIRTSVSMIAIGVAAAQFIGPEVVAEVHVVTIFSLLLVIGAIVLSILAGVQFAWTRTRINRGDYDSAMAPILLTVGITLVAGLLGVGVVLLLRQR